MGVPMQQAQPFYGVQPYMGATWRGPQNLLMGDQLPPALQQAAYSQQVADHLKVTQHACSPFVWISQYLLQAALNNDRPAVFKSADAYDRPCSHA